MKDIVKLLETLLHENMCSHAGDELIREFLKEHQKQIEIDKAAKEAELKEINFLCDFFNESETKKQA